jgi:hypothetical protein
MRNGCFTCEHFRGEFFADHLVCEQQVKPRVIGDAGVGCAFWLRATGSDD